MSIEQKVSVNTHYTRSVNLERDASSVEVVKAYIPTSRALRTFAKVADGFHSKQAPRAWSWVGPYGSGKSTASVFLGRLLANPENDAAKVAYKVLAESDKELAQKFASATEGSAGYLQILITGSPEPMAKRLLKGFASAASAFWSSRPGRPPAIVKSLEQLADEENPKTSDIIAAVDGLQAALGNSSCAGVVLVIDELGKFLEYEARHYGANDIYLLQALAEHACRGHSVNLMLFVLLHQSFEQYAKGLGESLKNEWSKVQGRFEEVPFLEASEQVLRVVSAAFNYTMNEAEHKLIETAVEKVVAVLDKQDALPGAMTAQETVNLFSSCYPLHPISALLLPLLCQKIAQNERTLFSYLGSHEEFGLQDMLLKLESVGDFIYPHHIYDYFITNQSSALGDYMTHRRWAEVVTAVERLGNVDKSDINLLKTIGILNIIGSKGGFKPSKALLQACMPESNRFSKSIKVLEGQSVVNFRRYSGEYRVWQGSDFDLEEALQEELSNLGEFSLVEELNRSKVMVPVVARRYTIKNGTLRYFTPCFVDASSFKKVPVKTDQPRIIYFLAAGQDDEKIFQSCAREYFSNLDVVALCLNGSQLREAVAESQALRRVGIARQELNSDPVAKREYEDRLSAAQLAEDKLLQSLTDMPQDARWYYKGEEYEVDNKRQFQVFLSLVLEKVYDKAPALYNELMNRDNPSSQAVAARNKLLYAMLTRPTETDLGIEKFPPEKAVYRSLLKITGLHKREAVAGDWSFAPAPQDGRSDKSNLRHAWAEIERFLDSTESEARSFIALNETLMAPPYGLKAGVLPILYFAAYLTYQHEIAVYESRRYRAYFTQEMIERFVKRPDEFQIQRFRIEGMRASIFEQYGKVIHGDTKKKHSLLELAKPLATFMGQLPEYTQKTKRGLSKKALDVRVAFNLAKSPETLLFEALPKALGYSAVSGSESNEKLECFSSDLTAVLRELRDHYGALVSTQRQLLAQAFNINPSTNLSDLRRIISGNCHGLEAYTVDTQGLRAFIMRVNKAEGSDEEWLENILIFLGHKPSAKWLDADQDAAEYRLTDFSRRVIDLEKLRIHERDRTSKMQGDFDVYLLRSIKKGGEILDDVVAIDNNCEKRISSALDEMRSTLSRLDDDELKLAALAKISDEFLMYYKAGSLLSANGSGGLGDNVKANLKKVDKK
ncbi:hypothetical protein [Aestuariirhabdus litorea]|uniref:ATP-binding protein n=1 Tax=Aestuariirhabdus litorea TaxID=2528527 RepID=A0A3P3VS99_9GAMM|nr:hypothetical protein [Aestuariirhabdus litorea]RRJ84379.1 hypothetical protein D0544_04530 [Aestuariirhabdus litorea]RWW97603.1 hypothetical protein DZC74_04525 [Endozoicomonadaceae bacterium GTF-13]